MGAGNLLNTASGPRVPYRRHEERWRSERAAWDQRSPVAARRNRARGTPHIVRRIAAAGAERLARTLSRNHDLLHWPREGEALLFLEALLRQEPFGKIPRVAYESRHRLSCRDGW